MTDTQSDTPTAPLFRDSPDYGFLQRAIDESDSPTVPADARLIAWMPSPAGQIASGYRSLITIVLASENMSTQGRQGAAYLIVTAIHRSDTDSFHEGRCEIVQKLDRSDLLTPTHKGYLVALVNHEVRTLPDVPFWERAITAAKQRGAEKGTGSPFPDLRGDIPLYSGIDPRAATTASMLLVCRSRVTGTITTLSADRQDGDVPGPIMLDSGDSLDEVEVDLGTPIMDALKWFSAFDTRDRR